MVTLLVATVRTNYTRLVLSTATLVTKHMVQHIDNVLQILTMIQKLAGLEHQPIVKVEFSLIPLLIHCFMKLTNGSLVKKCPDLKSTADGTLSVQCSTRTFKYGTSCNFSCAEGYRIVGSQTRICMSIGYWSGIKAKCQSKLVFFSNNAFQ